MQKLKKLFHLIIVLPVITWAQGDKPTTTDAPSATEFESEIDLNLSAGLYRRYKIADQSFSETNLQLTYQQDLGAPFQVGGIIGTKSFESKNYITLYAIGTANLIPKYEDAFYVTAGIGLKTIDELDESAQVYKQVGRASALILIGKRIQIRKNINYKPYIAFSKAGNQPPEYILNVLNFSLNW